MSKDPKACLIAALDDQGVTDNDVRAGIAAIAMGESRMQGHVETGYAHTSNDRIRLVFGSRVEGLSDEKLDELKSDERKWFNFIYGSSNSTGRMLGNHSDDDGYNFRGRCLIQLTGRANYAKYGEETGHPEIVTNPDLANDPEISAALAVAYILDRYEDGSGFDGMMRCVGNNTPDIRATKEQFYEKFKSSGEYNATDAKSDETAPVSS